MQRRFFLTATTSLLMASGFLSSPVFAATRVMDTDLVIVGGAIVGNHRSVPNTSRAPSDESNEALCQLMSGVGDTR